MRPGVNFYRTMTHAYTCLGEFCLSLLQYIYLYILLIYHDYFFLCPPSSNYFISLRYYSDQNDATNYIIQSEIRSLLKMLGGSAEETFSFCYRDEISNNSSSIGHPPTLLSSNDSLAFPTFLTISGATLTRNSVSSSKKAIQ